MESVAAKIVIFWIVWCLPGGLPFGFYAFWRYNWWKL